MMALCLKTIDSVIDVISLRCAAETWKGEGRTKQKRKVSLHVKRREHDFDSGAGGSVRTEVSLQREAHPDKSCQETEKVHKRQVTESDG